MDMERRLQELLDVGEGPEADEELARYLASDVDAHTEAAALARINDGLRLLGRSAPGSTGWEATAAAVLKDIDRPLEELNVEAAPFPDAPDESYRTSNATFGMGPIGRGAPSASFLSRWPIFAAVAVCLLAVGTWYAGEGPEFAVQNSFAEEPDNAVAATTASEPVIATLRGYRGVQGVIGHLRDGGVTLTAAREPGPPVWMTRLDGAPEVLPMRVDGGDLTVYLLEFGAEDSAVRALADIEESQPGSTALRRGSVLLFATTIEGAANLAVFGRVTAAFGDPVARE